MTLTLDPSWEKFVEDQVKAGRFSSPAEVLTAGLARLMLDPQPDVLDAQDIIDIRLSLAQMDRGELIDSEEVHARMREKYLAKKS